MQRILFLITIISSIVNSLKAQQVTYNDLKYGLCHNIGETKTYLSKKGFSLSSIDSANNSYKENTYSFAKNAYESMTMRTFNNKSIEIDLYTTKRDDYFKIISCVKSIGYKLISTRSAGKDRVIFAYKSRDSEIDFMVTSKTDRVATYYITLTNTKLRQKEIESSRN